MTKTPNEKQLDQLATEAAHAGDFATLERIATMTALVRGGQYGTLQAHFPFLRPIYRARLGAPPSSRAEDEARGSPATPL